MRLVEVDEASTVVMRQHKSMRILVWHIDKRKERRQRRIESVKEALGIENLFGSIQGSMQAQGGGDLFKLGYLRLIDPRYKMQALGEPDMYS